MNYIKKGIKVYRRKFATFPANSGTNIKLTKIKPRSDGEPVGSPQQFNVRKLL